MDYIYKVQSFVKENVQKLVLSTVAISGLMIVLTACSIAEPSELQTNSSEHNHIFTLDLLEGDTKEALEEEYKAEIIIWEPENGFAILGTSQDDTILPQSVNLESNVDTLKLPVFASGQSGWASGQSGWASGQSGWASGPDGWSEGASGWAVGNNGWAVGDDGWISGDHSWKNGVNDLFLTSNQAAWEQIDLFAAHSQADELGDDIKVAVIDTGVDTSHPMIRNNLTPSHTWRDYIDDDSNPQEEDGGAGSGHGTAVAGIILQIAPRAEILPIRVLKSDGTGDMDDVILAIHHAVESDADIINLSIGSNDFSDSLKNILLYAKANGVFVVAAAGNTGEAESIVYPAKMAQNVASLKNHIFSIGSVDTNNAISSFSASSNDNMFFAPGEQIRTAFPNEKLANVSGTSFAAPVFTGALALNFDQMKSDDREHMHSYAKSSFSLNVNSLYNTDETWRHGYGILNANAFFNTSKIENPAFEDQLDDWQNFRVNIVQMFNGEGLKGNGYMAELEPYGNLRQNINLLKPETTYELSFDIGFNDSSGSAEIELEAFDSNLEPLVFVRTAEDDTSSLKRVVIKFKTGVSNISAKIKVKNEAHKGNVYIDSFRLSVIEPTP